MTELVSCDSFTAFTTNEGIFIKEKKKSAKKFGALAVAAGIVFVGISFLPLDNLTYEWIMKIFYASFLWGGISIIVVGLLVFIAKGLMGGDASTSFDNNKRELTLRGKVIPYAEIDEISAITQDIMKRKMTMLMVVHKGKKKALVGGGVITTDSSSLEKFAKDLHAMVKG